MTDKATESHEPATPRGVSSSEGLGRVVPERAAFDRWQADSAPELWENNCASLGGTAWAAWVGAKEHARKQMEHVGWQHRWIDPEEGPSLWVFCDAVTADLLRPKKNYEVRPVFAERPNVF
jgi:hypothetical protein